MKRRPIEILLVEDNPIDVKFTIDGLKEGKISNILHVVRDGEEALDFLFQRGRFPSVSRPDLILLDLNLPKIDGCEILGVLKSDRDLMKIPVVVLTSSKVDEDILSSHNLDVEHYVTKPVDLNRFIELVKAIDHFCFSVVRLTDSRDPVRKRVHTRMSSSSVESHDRDTSL